MADNNSETKLKKSIARLYKALRKKDYKFVDKVRHEFPQGLLQRISLHNDTVLHVAAHTKQKYLVLDLLKRLPEDCNQKLSGIKNNDGNTILHEVATSDVMTDVAKALLERNADLLTAINHFGEKPIFCAARYGQTQMFKLLGHRMKLQELSPEDGKAHLQRSDGTTVLHISIATECFELAMHIVLHYPYLIKEKDKASMTALQYLACNPHAFERKTKQVKRGVIDQLRKSTSEGEPGALQQACLNFFPLTHRVSVILSGGNLPPTYKRNERYFIEAVVEQLIKNDTSLDVNIDSPVVGLGEGKKETEIEEHSTELSQTKEEQNSSESSTSKNKKSIESPLFLATMSNIKEIVKGILNFHPQALEQINKEGMNILHVAILYRHIDIFDMAVKSEVLARRLLSATDNEGNSILHMVSQKRKGQASEKMQSPALQLREELLLFEKVKSASVNLVSNPLNNDNKTAEELFAATNEKLHQEAKEWLMRTTENCTILSVFIATVAFAAAYTVPGGPNQDTGIPLLHSKPFFLVFILADVISLTLALTSVGKFLSILTSSFPLEDFKTYLFTKLIQGIICLVLSVSMMAVAFGATIILMMTENRKKLVWDVVAFLPVPIFFLSYSPLRSAVVGPCREWFSYYVVNLRKVFVGAAMMFLAFLFILLYKALRGLLWTVKKARELFICKPVRRWICGNKYHNSKSYTTQV